jgi:hypothetical protein
VAIPELSIIPHGGNVPIVRTLESPFSEPNLHILRDNVWAFVWRAISNVFCIITSILSGPFHKFFALRCITSYRFVSVSSGETVNGYVSRSSDMDCSVVEFLKK